MSSMHYSAPLGSVDAHISPSTELNDNLDLNRTHLPTTPFDSTLLSPFNYSHTISNSASPLYHINSSPGDCLSEYSNNELSEIDDEFFGVDFDAGVQRIDSLPSTLRNVDSAVYPTSELNYALPRPHQDLPERKQSPEALTTSTYPLSPRHTSTPNTPSPNGEIDDLETVSAILQPQRTAQRNNSRSPFQPLLPTLAGTAHLTPDHSGSSRASAEGIRPSTMGSPHVTISQWGNEEAQSPSSTFLQPREQYCDNTNNSESIGDGNFTSATEPDLRAVPMRDEDGQWKSGDETGPSGLNPESRKLISDIEVPTLKQQEEKRRIDDKNTAVETWRSRADSSSGGDDEQTGESYFDFEHNPPGDEADIAPVSDTASIRQNRLFEEQVYYETKNATINDLALMQQSRHWNDAPMIPYSTDTNFQPGTSNAAIQRWKANADAISLASRAATWGTRRRSAPSLLDYESVTDGNFLKKLTITMSKEGERRRSGSILDHGLDSISSLVRRSNSKLKRARSSQNIPDEAQNQEQLRKNSQGNLAPPSRSPSFGRRQTPSINTALAAIAVPLSAVGTTHIRSGSLSATIATSPRSPRHLVFGSVLKRARARSELSPHDRIAQRVVSPSGLAELWRGQGGPPVPSLGSPPADVESKQLGIADQDEDEDEDDDLADDSDPKLEPGQQSYPITPNFEGFKEHVRRLNPEMAKQYQWLVSRIAHQLEIRYKNLLDLRIKHLQALGTGSCSAGIHCVGLGGSATLWDAKRKLQDSRQHSSTSLQQMMELSDDSNPGEGVLTTETFPPGVPMPPTQSLPAEFECQLCFKAKKFQKPSDWTKHVHEDVQPFICTYDQCKEPKSFKRKADWVRHENERHRHLEWWVCQVDDCTHPCYRKDNFLQHLVREHKLPEPKQKTKAAVKKARGTEPVWMMLEKCHNETKNKPQDEPCKFCGKSFTTWKKLTVHLAKHMEHISLPILKLVESRDIDVNTMISPVEQNVTPTVTPISRTKLESASPFNISSISPHVPVHQQFPTFDQPFFPTTGPTPGTVYGMQSSIPQGVTYDHSQMYTTHAFGGHQMDHARGFDPMSSNTLNHIDQARAFGSMDSSFSHSMPESNYHPQPSDYLVAQEFTSGPPAVSNYQTPNMLSNSDAGFNFSHLTVNTAQGFDHVPITSAPGTSSAYGHSTHSGLPTTSAPGSASPYGHHQQNRPPYYGPLG